ncbi:multifunctional CCA addition/repair protein [Paraglaciecola sp. MB-3u-78]|uniref:multifunctional CCA addition/repair protein n=1 Tax=Paraglaciecola sp. MB-3u-78 TaxID=2058332 RepID=UPI000C31ED1F|nr:multifunctional CCA addition/repair protein [Paraglaciecola sp. MB-3u-78]PKG98839.1 multifunctional CCA addition/repair protein [Paraglaciecola sp. MB-3u-78]
MQTYLVGGAVRDKLLGRPIKDRDWVVVGSTPKQMLAQGYQAVGADFPVFLHPNTKEEYALARIERKIGAGYTGFICDASSEVSLEEDLLRRDLTINAMAMDDQGNIIDPYHGQQDLENRLLRHVSDAFVEDPLRVLRVARFAARYYDLGFRIAPETLTLMQTIVANGELTALSAERVWQESARSLLETHPEVYFENLRACKALAVWFPELDVLWGIPNPPKWHPEIDTGIHTMMVLQQAVKLSDKLTVRFAALVHDLGKGLTSSEKWPSHPGHEKLGLEAINTLCDRLKAPNDCRELGLMVSEFHTHVHNAFELKHSTILGMLNRCDVWRKPQRFADCLLTCKADARGRTTFEESEYKNAEYIWQAYEAAAKVDIKAIVAKGYQGKAIKEQTEQQRIGVIQTFKRFYKT